MPKMIKMHEQKPYCSLKKSNKTNTANGVVCLDA